MQRYSIPSSAPARRQLSQTSDDAAVPSGWADDGGEQGLPNRSPVNHAESVRGRDIDAEPVPRIVTQQAAPTPIIRARPTNAPRPEQHHDAVLFVRGIINEAIAQGSSDIHFEPKRDSYRIRFRIDGVLRDFTERPGDEYSVTLNAVKVLADLDIAERMLPQDGHLELVLQAVDQASAARVSESGGSADSVSGDRYYDIRVSVFPSVNGEVIVMRVLNRASALLSVEDLGMDPESLERLRQILLTSYGMVLITGPTGSGKTTTLYSVLSELKSKEKNIITLEDPIEFHLDWMRQCEIREDRGFTFERAMSSVLRQDPDILMVGEIRDPATAEYAVRSALVGRIVGSTIHANTAIGTIARLLDLGISRSILAHSIHGIIAQRLVRGVCSACKEEYDPPAMHRAHFGLENVTTPFYHGRGCGACNGTGYKGRTGLFSVMIFSDEIRSLIFDQRSLAEVQDMAIKQGMRTLKMDAALKIVEGLTTVEEAARVV